MRDLIFPSLETFTCLDTDYGVMRRFPVLSRMKVLTGVELCLTVKVSKLLLCFDFSIQRVVVHIKTAVP